MKKTKSYKTLLTNYKKIAIKMKIKMIHKVFKLLNKQKKFSLLKNKLKIRKKLSINCKMKIKILLKKQNKA